MPKGKRKGKKKAAGRGAPKGNRNAVGHGAPVGNVNAETHGAYSRPRLTPEEQAAIDALTDDFETNALRTLKNLEAKRKDLERRLAALDNLPEDEATLLDRSMTMIRPDGTEVRYVNRSGAFARRMILEGELNRVDGRIIKLLDSFKSYHVEQKRLELERERFEFKKQTVRGVFCFDESGNVVPEDDADEIIDA